MAFIYEVNGVRVQFDHEPTDADIDEAARGLGAKPESRMPKPVEGAGGAAFGVYRPAGRRPESQQDREASKDMAVQTVRGIASNVPALAGIPGSVVNAAANLPRTAQNLENRYQKAREAFTGQAPQEQPLPEYNQVTPYDMNYFAQLTPGPQPSSPAGQLAFGAGQMAGAPIVPPVMKAAGPALKAGYNLAKDTAELAVHPIQTARTGTEAFMRGYRNPEMMGQRGSAMMPIRETYYPHEQVAEYQAGTRGPLQMTEQPTSNLIQTPTQRWAQSMAPVNEQGQPLVAPKGRGFEGYLENLGAGYKQNPTQQIIDAVTGVGGMALTGGLPTPITALSKTVPALAARTLQQATQFEPGFEAAAVHAAQARSALEAGQPPTQNLLPAPGPVAPQAMPMPGPQRIVNIEGQRSVLPHQIDTANSAAQTPKQVSQQMAAQKLQQTTQPQAPAPAPVAQPVAPAANLPEQRWTDAERLQVQQAMNQPKVETPTEKPPIAEPTLLGPKGPTPYKDSLLKKYGSEKLVGEKATEVERALVKQESYPEKHATVSVSGSHASKLKNVLNEAEASGQPFRVTVTGKNGGYEMIYNSDSFKFAGDNSLKITKAKLIDRNSIDFSGTTSEGVPFTAETRGANTIIKDTSGNVIAEYKGAQQVSGPSKKGPSNVSQMLTEDTSGPKQYSSKEQFEKERMVSMLKEIPHEGSYPQGDKIIHVEAIKYGNLPKDITSTWEQTKMFATDKSGKRVPIGKEWTEADPEPLTSQLKRKLKRD